MATFYVMPSRHQVGQRFQEFLTQSFPGLQWSAGDWRDLAEALAAAAQSHPQVFVVFREDLSAVGPLEQVLQQEFGAEEGDEIIEVSFHDQFHRRSLVA